MNLSPHAVPIQLFRTFSPVADREDAGEDWSDYFSPTPEKLKWDDLREKPVVVVLGQAGIGKSIEFQLEVQRLRNAGKPAFVVALNQLVEANSWGRALVDAIELYERWRASNETAYFFLDAVDEARLTGPSAFVRALSEVRFGLRDLMARARFVISSRPADWSIDGVSAAVDKYLSKPIATALSALTEIPEPPTGTGLRTVKVIQSPKAEPIEAQVVNLDPLAISEAKRLADAFGVRDAIAFWDAVSDGGYAFMATRPLDLGWMVDLWNEQRAFGTYRELIDFNVKNRLTEVNQSYLDAGVVLSADRMRLGAEELAAAAEFSGRAYIATGYGPSVQINEVAPASVLSDWQPNEVERLLASAVFDEATFGRVRFHHRTTRAYLAACWVHRQLAAVPFDRLRPLFASSPFGTPALIPNRRWVLCWLATICAEVREWLMRQFPEMLLFDGDPQEWDSASADQAFEAYVQRLRAGLRTDWNNDESEFRRVSRRLSPGLVSGLLATSGLPSRVIAALLPVVKYGRLTDCAGVVFGVYQNPGMNQRTREYALDVLVTIASSEQRLTIKEDLVLGRLTSDELVAAALPVIDWQALTVAQLVTVFSKTKTEDRYRGESMAQAIKDDLLPTATTTSAELLLRAVLHALPRPDAGRPFSRTMGSGQPERAWLLDVLPDCFERLLTLLPRSGNDYPQACIEAAERLEAMRDSGFTEQDEFKRLFARIAEHPWLRRQVALEIAKSESIQLSINRLTCGSNCLVHFSPADLSTLTAWANDMDAGQAARNIWFTVALEVVFRALKGRGRARALASLASGPDVAVRNTRIAEQRICMLHALKQRRQWNAGTVARANEQAAQRRVNRVQLASDIDYIRSAAHTGSLHWLIHYSYNYADHKSFTRVDFGVIARDFGQPVADALAAGLKKSWTSATTPNPVDYKDGAVPWDALTALAGLHALLSEGVEIASLTNAEAARAAKLAVWELNGPPNWFEPLVAAHGPIVSGALWPWMESEAVQTTVEHRLHRVLEMVLRCSAGVRAVLLVPMVPVVAAGRIGDPDTLKVVVKSLRSSGLVASNDVANLCRAQVIKSQSPDGLFDEWHWFHTWLEEDAVAAWGWFEQHLAGSSGVADQLVKAFARAAQDCRWVQQPADEASIDVLLRMHRVLTRHLPTLDAPVNREDAGVFEPVVTELRSRIQIVLVQSRGAVAHRALTELMVTATDPDERRWLGTQVAEHAALEAAESSQFDPLNLRGIGSPFLTSPKTEAQLFVQVMARLEEVRIGTEQGPFSDRSLFRCGMPEEHVRNWLAARFSETRSRQFVVTPEEQVDRGKKPDIQLGHACGKVCVEIKPLDEGRAYSANSLTDTLRIQVVKQYLRGLNSSHGVLVLFRLDDKTWDIPGGAKRQPFSALVEYLQAQADIIRSESAHVNALKVFGIDCVA